MPREHLVQGNRPVSMAVLATLVVVIALFHFLIPTTSHEWHELHIVLRKLYFLPPVVEAVWFGFGGAIWTTLAVSGLFMTHAVLDWPGNYMEQANQGGELLGFWVVALLAGQLFDRQRTLLEGVATAHEETVDGLVAALDLREHNTGMHSHRVREYTLLLADRLGVDRRLRHHIAYGALLHDIGKIAVPDQILLKPGHLTDEEWVEIRKHPGVGYGIVRHVPFLQEAAEIVHAHHEHFDGRGYPRGLHREGIPLGARLFAVADVYDALTSERPCRSPMTYTEAAAEIRAGGMAHNSTRRRSRRFWRCRARTWRPWRSGGTMRPRSCRPLSDWQLLLQRLREFFDGVGFMHHQIKAVRIFSRVVRGGHERPHARTCALTSDGPGIVRRDCARDARVGVGPLRRRSSRRLENA